MFGRNSGRSETTDVKVRRLLAHELRIPESTLKDDFLWIEEVTREDVGWVLTRLQDAFEVRLFSDFIGEDELGKIATVGGLVTHIQTLVEGGPP